MEDEDLVAKKLQGGQYHIDVVETGGTFEAEVYKKNQLLWVSDEYDTYDGVITELSEMHEALKAIFG